MGLRRIKRLPTALRGLGGVKAAPLVMAEIVVGRGQGLPIGREYNSGAARCTIGGGIQKGEVKNGRIAYPAVRREILKARATQVGTDGTNATITSGEGVWLGGREPTAVAQFMWIKDQSVEPTPRAFYNNMLGLCQIIACKLAQKETLVRLTRPQHAPVLLRCSPTGAPFPVKA